MNTANKKVFNQKFFVSEQKKFDYISLFSRFPHFFYYVQNKNECMRFTEFNTACLHGLLRYASARITFAESCTGGLIAGKFTEIKGASEFLDVSFVTYSNHAKEKILGVKRTTLEKFGAVSSNVAGEMAVGAVRNAMKLNQSRNNCNYYSVSVTGIAGPDGGTCEKPVGTVFIAVCNEKNTVKVRKYSFSPLASRENIQALTVLNAISFANEIINEQL